jgi:hypothetical protein
MSTIPNGLSPKDFRHNTKPSPTLPRSPQWARADSKGDESDKIMCIRTIRDQPFADVSHSMLRQSSSPNASILLRPDILSVLRRREIRQALT